MKHIQLPIGETDIRILKVGDEVAISGVMVTARDAAHKYIIENWPKWVAPLLKDRAIYHCGPVVRKDENGYHAISAGPTTSIREEHYEPQIIAHYGPRIIIGKGGMGDATLAAMQKSGAVYVHATGGAASFIARSIRKIHNVYMLDELGPPEAFWEMEVEDFTGVVTMDAHGGSLHNIVRKASEKRLHALLQ
ncbi:MAG: fumarate hydratase C-terminal domain-containing protein [Deltaproteobacteria bacterium]|nr:fumarate hydratase C-terminal domain-containing protein [Deltaproteobacteria bacterium]